MNREKIIKILSYRSIRYFVIPFVLFALWPLLSFLIVPRQSLTTISQKYYIEKSKLPVKKFAQTYKISSEFRASYENLGIVSIHQSIITDHLEETDRLLFHIKEKGQNSWHYENVYKEGFFNRQGHFPFGFPIIRNSKGKTYQFEVISLSSLDNMDVSKLEPEYTVSYKYLPKEMFFSPELRSAFIKNVFNNFIDGRFISYSSLFFFPFLLYLLYISSPKILSVKDREYPKDLILLGVIVLFIIYDIEFVSLQIYGLLAVEIIFLIIYYQKNKLPRQISIILCLFFFFLSELFILFNLRYQLDKSSVWVFIFICISFIQTLYTVKSEKN